MTNTNWLISYDSYDMSHLGQTILLNLTNIFSDMSSLGLLSKAERTGNNISKYGFGREVGCPYFWSPWVDDLYSPDWHIKINTRYPWKE